MENLLFLGVPILKHIRPVYFQTPILESITPGSGPVSGGTKVTIGGQHLDAGSEVTVRIKDYPCYVINEE